MLHPLMNTSHKPKVRFELHEKNKSFQERAVQTTSNFDIFTTTRRPTTTIDNHLTLTQNVKTGQLWSKNKADLAKQLGELKTELGQLRTQKIAGGSAAKLTKIHDVRKSIAKVLTVINANQRAQLRLFYKGKKYLPLDLRSKQTRAIRRRLSKHEKELQLEKTKKRSMHFPQRKFAVKAEA
ncbi:putative 60s ribosomal protein l35 protein [Botrytis fragariae]|uniref:Putative 60s ribosomal protein l35 protein n=1 Tax=Botrytis fragariae TaxID=1964551 RepID=A0A8H6AMY8_9HELO|nr:putative 60s ribosomal protein l35 protein [Botrytis fragariae]KAF5870215.1 putative 60s ribosomal protein l35 protein [Botrytis fragariae]